MNKEGVTKQAVRRVLRDYWGQYKKYPGLTLGSFLLPGLGSIFVFFIPPLIISRIVNILARDGVIPFDQAGALVLLFGGLWLFGEVCWRVGMYFLTRLEYHGMYNLARKSFAYLIERDYDFFTSKFVGSLTKKAQSYTKNFEGFTDTFSFNITPNILPMIFALIILARYSLWISLLLLAALAVVVALTIPLIRARSKIVAERHDASSKMTGNLSDILTNIFAVKSFASETIEGKRFDVSVKDYTNKFKKAAFFHIFRIDAMLSPLYVITNMIGLFAALYFTQKFNLEPGALVVVFSYYSTVTRTFWQINNVYRNIESNIGEAAEFTALVIDPPLIEDTSKATPIVVTEGLITFSGVNFGYIHNDDSTKPFLKNFSVTIAPGEKVGLVGPSGGGKTTITKLLLRFLDVQSGSILIDGQDIKHVTQASLRGAISYVPQEPLLFHRSLAENIAYGKEDTLDSEIVHVAKLAHADEFISELPHQYETLVGERGVKLSGGQRQRIAIARALLKESPILILDEATSALDSESEKYIQEGFEELMKGKTTLVVAHRLSTIKHLDRIIVLDKGNIVQDGTHAELIKQKGLYAILWEHQSGGFIED